MMEHQLFLFGVPTALFTFFDLGITGVGALGKAKYITAVAWWPVLFFTARIVGWTGVQYTFPFCYVTDGASTWTQIDTFCSISVSLFDSMDESGWVSIAVWVAVSLPVIGSSIPGISADLEAVPVCLSRM